MVWRFSDLGKAHNSVTGRDVAERGQAHRSEAKRWRRQAAVSPTYPHTFKGRMLGDNLAHSLRLGQAAERTPEGGRGGKGGHPLSSLQQSERFCYNLL